MRNSVFPAADGLEGHTELFGKLVLRHGFGAAEGTDVITDVQFHDTFLSV